MLESRAVGFLQKNVQGAPDSASYTRTRTRGRITKDAYGKMSINSGSGMHTMHARTRVHIVMRGTLPRVHRSSMRRRGFQSPASSLFIYHFGHTLVIFLLFFSFIYKFGYTLLSFFIS